MVTPSNCTTFGSSHILNCMERKVSKVSYRTTLFAVSHSTKSMSAVSHNNNSAKSILNRTVRLEQIFLAFYNVKDCVIVTHNTGKVNMKYINAILESWHNAGIHTLKEAVDERIAAEARREGAHKPSYDLDEYEKYDIFATEK